MYRLKKQKKNLKNFLKFFKKKGIKFLEKKIIGIFLQISYTFIWEVFVKAKLLAHHSKRRNIIEKDIMVICIDFKGKIKDKKNILIKSDYRDLLKNYQTIKKLDLYENEKKSTFIENISYKDSYKIKIKNI
jgi:histone H3/H4